MPDTKPIEKASQVSAADLAALRDDITKLVRRFPNSCPSRLRLRQAWSILFCRCSPHFLPDC
jgi:hypothetical protein